MTEDKPVLMVRYECIAPTDPCGRFVLDAYQGPPMCVRHALYLRALHVVEGEPILAKTRVDRKYTPPDSVREEIRYGTT